LAIRKVARSHIKYSGRLPEVEKRFSVLQLLDDKTLAAIERLNNPE